MLEQWLGGEHRDLMDDREALAAAREIALSHLEDQRHQRQGTFIHSLFPVERMRDDDLRRLVDQLADLTAGLALQLGDLRRGFALPSTDPRLLLERKAEELQQKLEMASAH